MGLLNPQDRALLIESLRPPVGFQLDTAVGTTFSLDLISMMVAPVGFTLFELDPDDPSFLQQDPLEILEAIRRHASQIVLFCQAGRIAVPSRHRPLLAYLEDRIVEARTPTPGCSFHPKVWILRYVNDARDVSYRLLCSSRNLTFDRCWDTLLTLDGPLRADRTVGFGFNAGLQEFISALPSMAVSKSKVSPSVRKQVSTIEKEISRVEWSLDGTPFETLKFWPLGHDGVKTWPFKGRRERTLVVSPFVTASTLEKLASARNVDDALVSRRESLDTIRKMVIERFGARYQLATVSAILDPDGAEASEINGSQLQGLHAKLYIADDGWNARVWTGSANATASAFGGNVEFMVELGGKKSAVGVGAFLEKVKGVASFSELLEPYETPDTVEVNEGLEALKKELDDLRLPLAAAEWKVSVSPGETSQIFQIVLSSKGKLPVWPDHVSVRCRPLAIDESFAALLQPATVANEAFNPMALESLTAFVVLEVNGETAAGKHSLQFVVNAQLVGAPANRKERILYSMIHDQRALMRFLFLLLSDIGDSAFTIEGAKSKARRGAWNEGGSQDSLLEPMLRTLNRNPKRLNAVKNLLDELVSTEEGARLLPDGLKTLFEVIWGATEPDVS